MDQGQVKGKISGIPRPGASKLPVLGKRSSQIFPPTQAQISEGGIPNGRPALSKRSSVASFARPSRDTSPVKPPAPTTGLKKPSATGTKPPSSIRAPSSTRQLPTRPVSRALKRPTRIDLPKKATNEEEHQDQLGSLNGFRAASRQGFHDDDSPPGSADAAVADEPPTPRQRKPSRPSLSDRTMESLSSLPATPKERRRSSFFSSESPMGPPPRPGSSMSRPSSNGSRPGTSDGTFAKPALPQPKKAPASAKPASRTSSSGFGFGFTPNGNRRSASTASSTRLPGAKPSISSPSKATSPSKPATSRSLAARSAKPRPALGNAFAPPSTQPKLAAKQVPDTASSSSSALRSQIAAAKAAARKEREKAHDSPQDLPSSLDGAYEYNLEADPFNQAPKDGKHMLRNRINAARMSGKLNIAAMNLKSMPPEVMQMYDSAAMEESKVSFAEVVDLSKLIAADNEIEELGNDIFPDKSPDDYADDEDSPGNQFGGLEMLDLHGNTLSALPMGLRRLERLTSLNLAHNKLNNSAFEVISQITSLKDLKLGHNNISNTLPTSICELRHLESLDVQANRLLALPEALRELVSLRVLNVSGNQLTVLPMEGLQQLPLTELNASGNALIASLFPLGGAPGGHQTLRTLNIANNSLAALTFMGDLDMPRLQTLDVTNNHLAILPALAGWTELITLAAGDNKIPELPEGFTELLNLRNVNLSGNDLRVLPPQIANMDRLESLVLAANPLREKKYLTMSAADIKRDLRAKLEPEDQADDKTPFTNGGSHNTTDGPVNTWTLKPNNLLDLSHQNLTDAINPLLSAFLSTHPETRQINLQNNTLTHIPPALSLAPNLHTLNLSSNPLTSNPDPISLPSLKTLNLHSCTLTTPSPLQNLHAPLLQTLWLSQNNLTGPLPPFRTLFPNLTTLHARDNKFCSVSASALRGLQVVDLSCNALEALPAEIGLLAEEGLRGLEVGGNCFRVPGARVLEKGSEGLLRWLRGRVVGGGEGEGG